MKKKLVSVLILFVIMSFGGITINAVSTEMVDGIRFITYDDGVCVPYNGWTLIKGQRAYYYADGKRVTGLNLIKGIVYKFDKTGKSTGAYTGKAKGKNGTEYYKFGKKLEFTDEPKTFNGTDFFGSFSDKAFYREKMGGDWIKLYVRIDKVYPDPFARQVPDSYIPAEAPPDSEPVTPEYISDYRVFEGQTGYVYLPAMAANLILEADGFYLANDVIIDAVNFHNIIPIIDDKLQFYDESKLLNKPEDFEFDNSRPSAVTINGETIKLSDNMSIADFDRYRAFIFKALTEPKTTEYEYFTDEDGNSIVAVVENSDPILDYTAGTGEFSFRCTIAGAPAGLIRDGSLS
ncbi:MAG: hypothetical protein LBM87_06740 [Ruminococcus sp.]|jgi:hypothetical protein|nr:hypothetical protein [Ruminococcus sp.]